jgi:hypothetical protein
MYSRRTQFAAVVALALLTAPAVWTWHRYCGGQESTAENAGEPTGENAGDATGEWLEDPSWDPPQAVDPLEFQKRYARYFEADFMTRLAGQLDPNVNVDALHSSVIRAKDGPLGTLFLDNTGKVVLAVKYPFVINFSEGLAAVATKIQPKTSGLISYGYVDRTGQLVIPADYDAADSFREGLAAVQKAGKWGYINRRGELVIPCRYQRVEEFRDGVARAWPDHDTVQFIDPMGHVLYQGNSNDVSGEFSEGLLHANLAGKPDMDNGRSLGYLNRDFKFAIRLGPDSSGFWPVRCEKFHEGRAAVEIGNQQWGFIDRLGKLVVPASFSTVSPFSEGLAAVTVRRGTIAACGYIDRSGTRVIEPRFLSAGSFKEGLAPVRIAMEDESDDAPSVARPVRSRWGYIDRHGKVVIQPRFYQAGSFEHGLAQVSENPFHHGYIDKTGAYVWQVAEPAYGVNLKKEKPGKVTAAPAQVPTLATVTLELHAKTPVITLGERPQFRAELINAGKEPIVIVLPGDGSIVGWRTPIVRWKPHMRNERWCGNINALKADEVITLQPQARVDISEWIGWPTLNKVGTHKVVLEIENVPGHRWYGEPLGKHDAAAMARVRRSAPFKALSNTVEIRVED